MLSWHDKFRSSCPDSMEQNRLLVGLTSPLYTHTYGADSAGAARGSGHQKFRLPDFWSCSEESLLLLREEVQIETTEFCRHNLIYIQYIDLAWLIMVQEEVLRVLHISGGKQSAHTLCRWYQQTKSKSVIYIWRLVVRQTPFSLRTDFTHRSHSFNHSFLKFFYFITYANCQIRFHYGFIYCNTFL